MSVASRAILGAGLMLVSALGVVRAPSGTPATPGAAHGFDRGAAMIAVGDTIEPRYAIRTDTVLKVAHVLDAAGATHDVVVARACGVSVVFAGWAKRVNGVVGQPFVRDSVTLAVVGCSPSAPSVASLSACFLDPAVADSLHIRGDTTIDPRLIPPGACKS